MDQLSSKDAHLEVVRTSIPEFDENVMTEARRKQHVEFMAVSQQQC